MPSYVYVTLGFQESLVPDGHGGFVWAYVPVPVAPEELNKFTPGSASGFLTRKGDRTSTIFCPGDTMRLEVVEKPVGSLSSESPVTRKA